MQNGSQNIKKAAVGRHQGNQVFAFDPVYKKIFLTVQ